MQEGEEEPVSTVASSNACNTLTLAAALENSDNNQHGYNSPVLCKLSPLSQIAALPGN